MAEANAPLCCILDLPYDLLNQIILLLTPRERIPLGNSCRRFNALVFEEPELLRCLDFSKKAHLTRMTHIQQYFNDENACLHVRTVDTRNVRCVKPGDPLNNSIGRAINLVEVHIHGTRFENIWQLSSFLEPLQHLKKLSIDWPDDIGKDVSVHERILERPLSKLTYLSVKSNVPSLKRFTSCLSLCQQLKELYIHGFDYPEFGARGSSWNSEIKHLTNLRIVQFDGFDADSVQKELATVLPDPERWTEFHLRGGRYCHGFYIEKDVEVCEELLRSKRLQYFLKTTPRQIFNFKWTLSMEGLLKEVLRITHRDVPEDWCCFSEFTNGRQHLLKVEEAKLLLKNPRHQISGLYFNHELERGCDAHLLASAYPNLTELVLHSIRRKLDKPPKDSHFRRRLSSRYSPTPEKQSDSPNPDSSFKMLVENTPNLRHFTFDPDQCVDLDIEDWDYDAFCEISGWLKLQSLHMSSVPCADGRFLIEIGKRCKNLQELTLWNAGSIIASTNKAAICEMLENLHNLQDLTLEYYDIDQAELFALLAKNLHLERVVVSHFEPEHSALIWISSLENMIRQCKKLTVVNCDARFKTKDDNNAAVAAVERIRGECCRPDFEIRASCQIQHRRWSEEELSESC